ncbi:VWA domain-containing protein [Microbacterium album]|uniref:VWFA domain-containing protein n=1 Tax=Microbacterium album TaxID=2053191 RepID=A0A917MN94_9MICO|nr:VWA domain-containing protein [Microbacterium album]GGH50344.1 hypothetical protein GCM10010921_29040 [Microbacterium album]
MALATVWPLIAVAAAVLAAAGAGLAYGWRRRPGRDGTVDAALVARAERVRDLPAVRRATRRHAAAVAGLLALATTAALLGGVVGSRPLAEQTIVPENTSRDIMLCLDVSGSMSEVDVEVITVFEELLEGFEGERIGLTIFNSSPVQVFPLTDDYEFARDQLASIRRSFDYVDDVPEHWLGTLNGAGASLIGDGLAACALRFDHRDEERSRSIVFATDNEVNGASIVTLEEAAGLAAAAGVRVFALNPVEGKDADVSAQLAAAAASTGGAAYALRGATTVGDIISEVQRQEATALIGQARVVWADEPTVWIVLLLLTVLGGVVLMWRARL